MEQFINISTLLPTLLLFVSVIILTNKKNLIPLIRLAAFASLISAIFALNGLILLYLSQAKITTFGITSIGILFRVDQLSMAMLFMVSIIGFVVIRYSKSYLMGDRNHMVFMRRLILTVALVQFLMLSGSLVTLVVFWSGTSIALHFLLVFYKDRKTAQYSARKKFFVARVSDICLVVASVFLYIEFNTVNLEIIFNELQTAATNNNLIFAGVFLVIAAIFKSAQVPFHGWLLEVMEAPTPVSGLLHAGLLNAGPFLILRFAYLMEVSAVGSSILIIVGGVTALYGTIVFPSQPAIKTALAYSSVAHMGFSLMTCGLGIYSAALLHLMAHSFYKAHSFLSSGSLIEKYRLHKLRKNNQQNIQLLNIILGLTISAILYILLAQIWVDFQNQSLQMFMLGGVIVTGVSVYSTNALSFDNTVKMLLASVTLSSFVFMMFFLLEHFFAELAGNILPEIAELSIVPQTISFVILSCFLLAGLMMLFKNKKNSAANKWNIYRRNGFYIHNYLDKIMGSKTSKLLK